jgi:hypothetical protein
MSQRSPVFWFGDQGVTIDYVTTLVLSRGHHTCNFTICDRAGNSTIYAVEIDSHRVGTSLRRDLAAYVLHLVQEGGPTSVVRRFKEKPP